MVLHAGGDFSSNFFLISVHCQITIRYHLQASAGRYFVDESEIMARPDRMCRRSRIQSFVLC